MPDEEIKDQLGKIKEEFKKLVEFLVGYYGYKESEDIRKLQNLFRGLKDWTRKPSGRPFVHPAKIISWKAKIKKSQLTENDHNAIAAAKLRLLEAIHEAIDSYYKTDGKNSDITFYIESAQRAGQYRLKVLVNGKDFVDIVRKIRKTEISSKPSQLSLIKYRQFLDQYLVQVREDNRYLDIKHLGIIPFRKNSIELDEAYIRLTATKDVPLFETSHLTKDIEWSSGFPIRLDRKIFRRKNSPLQPLQVEEIIRNAINEQEKSKRHMIFLGPPGSGKTTLLRYLARSVASSKAERWGLKSFVPVFADLSYYASSGSSSLIQYALDRAVQIIVDDREKNDTKEALKTAISECTNNSQVVDGRVIFLLDALDETGERKAQIVEEIERIRNRYCKAVIIVTSRITEYHQVPLSAFCPYLIEDLQIQQISDFVNKWFNVFAQQRDVTNSGKDSNDWANDRAVYLLKQIEESPRLNCIATSPLYLTFLILLATDLDAVLPQTRSDLYRQYFDKLLFSWEKRREQTHGQELTPLYDDLLEGFKEICWIVHRALYGDIKDTPTKSFVKKSIVGSITLNPNQVLDFWIKAGILIVAKDENHHELLLPRHLSFLEYGFACKLNQLWDDQGESNQVWKDIKMNLHNCYLYEPLMIFVGLLKHPADFFDRVAKLRGDLFHSNLIFLSVCANEIKYNPNNDNLLKALRKRLLDLWISKGRSNIYLEWQILSCLILVSTHTELKEILEIEPREEYRKNIIHLIADAEMKAAIPFLKERFEKESNFEVRLAVTGYINKIGNPKLSFSLLKQLSGDTKHSHKTSSIALSFSKLKDTRLAISGLCQLFENVAHVADKISIAQIFARVGENARAISLLEKLLPVTNDPKDKCQLIISIAWLGGIAKSISHLDDLFLSESNKGERTALIAEELAHCSEKLVIEYLNHLCEYKGERSNVSRIDKSNPILIVDEVFEVILTKGILKDSCFFGPFMSFPECFINFEHKDIIISFLSKIYKTEPELYIKKKIVEGIALLGYKESGISYLKKIMENETEINDKLQSASLIGKMGDTDVAILEIKKLYEKADNNIKLKIPRLIAELGYTEEAVSYFKKNLNDYNDPNTSLWQATEIANLGQEKLATKCLKQVYEKIIDLYSKSEAALKIGQWGEKKLAISYLKELHEKANDFKLKARIASYIAELGERELGISYLRNIYKSATSIESKVWIEGYIYSIIKGDYLFEDERTQWKLIRTSGSYHFSTSHISNG